MDKSEQIKAWRIRWLTILYELTHIDVQRRLWIDNINSTVIGSYSEDICQYFDDLAIDDNYKFQIIEGYISEVELNIILEFHKRVDKYIPENESDHEILNDPIWQEIVDSGLLCWLKLKHHITDEAEKKLIYKLENSFFN